jgi:dihydrofolate synthase/folylpolyglutamate synthase
LKGTYQKENIITVLTALSILNDREFSVNDIAIRDGLRNVTINTGLLGRWQEIDHNPMVVCDIAHNTEGIKQILEQIENQPYKNLHMVLGFVSDKKINDIINILPKKAIYYLCEPKIPRAMKLADLSRAFQQTGRKYMEYNNVTDAYKSAKEKASKNDLIYIGGSTFVVADFLSRN